MRRWLIIALCWAGLAAAAPAASLQARLVRAANGTGPSDAILVDITPALRDVFGYEQYRQLGSQQQPLRTNQWTRLNLGQGFTVLAHPSPHHDQGQTLDVEVFSGKTSLTKAALKVRETGTVFIKGPEVGSTLMIIALTVRQ
jgi:hypothetical protein